MALSDCMLGGSMWCVLWLLPLCRGGVVCAVCACAATSAPVLCLVATSGRSFCLLGVVRSVLSAGVCTFFCAAVCLFVLSVMTGSPSLCRYGLSDCTFFLFDRVLTSGTGACWIGVGVWQMLSGICLLPASLLFVPCKTRAIPVDSRCRTVPVVS